MISLLDGFGHGLYDTEGAGYCYSDGYGSSFAYSYSNGDGLGDGYEFLYGDGNDFSEDLYGLTEYEYPCALILPV